MVAERTRVKRALVAVVVKVIDPIEPDSSATVSSVGEEDWRCLFVLLGSRNQQLKISTWGWDETPLHVSRQWAVFRRQRASLESE